MKVLTSEESLRLVGELTKLTREKALRWSALGDNDCSFVAGSTRYIYGIDSKDRDDYAPFRLRIWRKTDNKLVDSIESDIDSFAATIELNEELEVLYTEVARKTRKLDDIADDILSDLESMDEPF